MTNTLSQIAGDRARSRGRQQPVEATVISAPTTVDDMISVRIGEQRYARGPMRWASNGRMPQAEDMAMVVFGASEAFAMVWASGPLIAPEPTP